MLKSWRADQLGWQKVELWIVGFSTGPAEVASFCQGTDAACFEYQPWAGPDVFKQYSAGKDDLIVVDRAGQIHFKHNLTQTPLEQEANRKTVDAAVRKAAGQ
jgi:hypothetical protein